MSNSDFEMKYLGKARRILGTEIIRNKKEKTLCLSQSSYIKKIISKLKMEGSKGIRTPMAQQFKLSSDQAPKIERERLYIEKVPYIIGVGSIMYGMMCSKPNLAYVVNVISRFIANLGKTNNWEVLEWTLRYLKWCWIS